MQAVVVMNGTAKEIAALALAIQERRMRRLDVPVSSCGFEIPSIHEVEEFLNHHTQSIPVPEELLQWSQRKFDRNT